MSLILNHDARIMFVSMVLKIQEDEKGPLKQNRGNQ